MLIKLGVVITLLAVLCEAHGKNMHHFEVDVCYLVLLTSAEQCCPSITQMPPYLHEYNLMT